MVLSELTVWSVQKAWSVLTDESEPMAVSESTGESEQKVVSELMAWPELKAWSVLTDETEPMAVLSELTVLQQAVF
jgi:hypothetical protein